MYICESEKELEKSLKNAMAKGSSFFGHGGVFMEKYIPEARHIEIQVNGCPAAALLTLFF